MTDIVRLLRPLQWMKNVFVLAPLFFTGKLLMVSLLGPTLLVMAAFCLAASSIYCLNDVRDAEADRLHPKKRLRPIASGKVSVKTGYGVMVAAMVGAVTLALSVGTGPTVCIGIYLLINIAYCLKLKQVAILDVALIAIGFVLRVLGGGMATGIWISEWLVLMTFLKTKT